MGHAFDGGIIFNLELHLKELKPSKLFALFANCGHPKILHGWVLHGVFTFFKASMVQQNSSHNPCPKLNNLYSWDFL
jgi:hypothetical protein